MSVERNEPALDSTDAFSVLGNETRMAILRSLAEESSYPHSDEAISFSKLRRRVGVRDAGKFNYHLDRLRDHFVDRTDDGYHLRYAGMVVVSTVLSGALTDRIDPRTSETRLDCPRCGHSLTATYQEEFLELSCEEDSWQFRTALPPGAAEGRSMDELVDLALVDAGQFLAKARRRACPICWGEMEPQLSGDESDLLGVTFDCRRCWMAVTAPVVMCVLDHPTFVSFCHDRGVAVTSADLNGLELLASCVSTTVVSEDPIEVRVDVELDGDRLQLTLDGELAVTSVDRS